MESLAPPPPHWRINRPITLLMSLGNMNLVEQVNRSLNLRMQKDLTCAHWSEAGNVCDAIHCLILFTLSTKQPLRIPCSRKK